MDNKFLDHKIKEYFENREINPSDQSWDRLDAMLSLAPKQENKKLLLYYWIAACAVFVGMICVFGLFYQQKSDINNVAITTETPSIIRMDTVQSVAKEESKANMLSIGNMKKENLPRRINNFKHNPIVSNAQGSKYASYDGNDGIVAQVNDFNQFEDTQLEQRNGKFADSKLEIDANVLLREIEFSVTAKNIVDTKTIVDRHPVRPDPSLLLVEAEASASKSFLKRVFKNLHNSSESILVAVANRNVQK